jgi:hypothetical protein
MYRYDTNTNVVLEVVNIPRRKNGVVVVVVKCQHELCTVYVLVH